MIVWLLYNAALLLLSPLLVTALGVRLAMGKSRQGLLERLGFLPRNLARGSAARIWVHAASVGEVMAATPILRALTELRPGVEVITTVITPGGHEVATSQKGKLIIEVLYAPFDLPGITALAAQRIRPDVLVVLETELWPNLFSSVRALGAPIILVNGRLSDRSYPRYQRARLLMRWVLGAVGHIMAQTEEDRRRFVEIGAPADRTEVTGNSKFDQTIDLLTPHERANLRRELHLPTDAPVWIIGSTRSAEEERVLARAFVDAKRRVPGLCLIHAPRHVDRASEVAGILADAGLSAVLRTEVGLAEGNVEVLVLDTFGELARIYGACDVAFIGNSLVAPGGGQNLLQPLAHGVPTLYGRYMQNFRDLAAMADAAGVGFRCDTGDDVASAVCRLCSDADARRGIGDAARRLVQSNSGASDRYARAIIAALDTRGS